MYTGVPALQCMHAILSSSAATHSNPRQEHWLPVKNNGYSSRTMATLEQTQLQ